MMHSLLQCMSITQHVSAVELAKRCGPSGNSPAHNALSAHSMSFDPFLTDWHCLRMYTCTQDQTMKDISCSNKHSTTIL